MTPLAHAILKDSLLPPRKRCLIGQSTAFERMSGIHCFDVTEIIEAATEMAKRLDRTGLDGDLVFLPAPKTWVEWTEKHNGIEFRLAYLLEDVGSSVRVSEYCKHSCSKFKEKQLGSFAKAGVGRMTNTVQWAKARIDEFETIGAGQWRLLRVILAFINTPRVICRRQNMPHRGLEKLLRRTPVGKFPLHAWTEILLKVTPPEDYSDREPGEAHLTGKRALHFCRAHLRVRLGRLEFVSAHWRGHEELGTKRSRYRLAA